MRCKQVFLIITAMLMVGMLVITTACSKGPAPKQLPGGGRMVIGYYENPWPGTSDQSGSLPSMQSFAKSMSAVGPFWYRATDDGTLETKESQLAYDSARNLGLKMYPLVTNKSGATDAVLGNRTIRSKVIDNIVKIVQEKNYDGINLDFELLPPTHKDNLTAFVTELYPHLKKLNKTLIVSVFPKVDVADDVSGAYDYGKLAANADFLQIMTYDKHWATSKAGPIAPIDWYEKNIQYAIEKSGGAHKVIVGISAYGYDWPSKGQGETVTYTAAVAKAKQKGAQIMYDQRVQAPHFKYDGHEVWFENQQSTAAKLDVIAKYQPAGIAIWRLGQEQPEIWTEIDKRFPKQQ